MTTVLRGHNNQLQALRGLAALSVLVGHCLGSFPANSITKWGFALFQPHTAVVVFYVLSGFVLGEALRRQKAPLLQSWRTFQIKRLGRLLPVMLVSLLFAAVVTVALGDGAKMPGVTRWLAGMYGVEVTPWTFAGHAVMERNDINGVLWSVHVELAMAPLLPLAMIWVERSRLRADVAVLAILLGLAWIARGWRPSHFPVLGDVPQCAYCFYLGLIIPKLMAARWLGAAPVAFAALITLFAIDVAWLNTSWFNQAVNFHVKLMMHAGLAAVIICYLATRSNRWMQARPLVWLGDISYSLYAYALTVQMIVVYVLVAWWVPQSVEGVLAISLVLIGCVIVISCILATASYHTIEMPATNGTRRRIGEQEARARAHAAQSSSHDLLNHDAAAVIARTGVGLRKPNAPS